MSHATIVGSTLLTLAFIFAGNIFVTNGHHPLVVNTTLGPMKGMEVLDGRLEVHAYLGVPYAEPPIGELRFRKPVPAIPNSKPGLLEMVLTPPHCIQFTPKIGYFLLHGEEESENCLFINIWAPATACKEDKKAVMVWIPGMDFSFGYSGIKWVDGTALAAIGDVIVVIVQYRLGPLGFFTTNTEDAPGNVGIYDVLEALKFINKNIEQFGGDPSNITLAGHDEGAYIAGLLAESPLAKGLFHRIILQSRSPVDRHSAFSETKSREGSAALLDAFECGNLTDSAEDIKNAVNCLRSVDVTTLKLAVRYDFPDSKFIPTHDVNLLPNSSSIEALKNGEFHDVDVMIGNTLDEGSSILTLAFPDIFGIFGFTVDYCIDKNLSHFLFHQLHDGFQDRHGAFEKFIQPINDTFCSREILVETFATLGDYWSLCPNVFFAESFAKKNRSVYFYVFNHRPLLSSFSLWMDVTNGAEVPFLFGQPLYDEFDYTEEEIDLSFDMIKMWTDFAKTGKPELEAWPKFSREDPEALYLVTGPYWEIGNVTHLSRCDYYRPFFGFD